MKTGRPFKPLISIITITYNAASVIEPTIKSIISQTFHDFEHIVVDGASTDNTLAIIQSYTTNSKVLSEPDKGLYDAMNKGLHLAKGKYILFLNAGDSFHSDHTLQHYVNAIISYHQSTSEYPPIVYGDTVIVNKEREYIRKRHLDAPERLTFKSFSNGMLVCHQAFMVRRDLAPDYDLKYKFSADYDWTIKCLCKAEEQLKNKEAGSNNLNLKEVTIDYLSDGLTDKNHKASLIERFHIMSRNYGMISTIFRHIHFLFRNISNKRKKYKV